METYDVVVIGAGFAGLYALHRLRNEMVLSVLVVDAEPSVGGTWYRNRYPGARCDVESTYFSYSFDEALQQEWTWPHRYAFQPEVLDYLDHVADRFDLRRSIRLSTRCAGASWDAASARWQVRLTAADGDGNGDTTATTVAARFLVTATGGTGDPTVPDLPGLDRFAGTVAHTLTWPADLDLTGKKVAVLGTGSSGIQVTVAAAAVADQVTVLQRSASWVVPARNRVMPPAETAEIKAHYPELRTVARTTTGGATVDDSAGSGFILDADERRRVLDDRWARGGFHFLFPFDESLTDATVNRFSADYIADRIRETVTDPHTAALLTPGPAAAPVGARRLCIDTDWYATFNRDNVALVDLTAEPVREVTATGIVVGDRQVDADVLVLATGVTGGLGALGRLAVTGRDGLSLQDAWSDGPHTYLGMTVPGFPNLFVCSGPGSPAALVCAPPCAEQQVQWISGLIDAATRTGHVSVEPTAAAVADWDARIRELAETSLYSAADPYWRDAVFTPYATGLADYRRDCDAVAAEDYRGFVVR